MPRLSVTIQNEILNAMLNNVPMTLRPSIFVSLHSADPGTTGANEMAAQDYARAAVAFNAPTAGSMANSAPVDFPAATSAWGSIPFMGLWDAATGGTFMIGAAVAPSTSVNIGDQIEFATGAITVSDNS